MKVHIPDQVEYRKRLQLGPRNKRRTPPTLEPVASVVTNVPRKPIATSPAEPPKLKEDGKPSLAQQLRAAGIDPFKDAPATKSAKPLEVVDFMGGMQKNVSVQKVAQPDEQLAQAQRQITTAKVAKDDVL